MWKGEGFLGNSEEGIGKKFPGFAWGIPPPRQAEAPPLWQGGLWSTHLLHRSNDTGRVREVTITDQLGAKLTAAARRKAPLPKGAGTPEA